MDSSSLSSETSALKPEQFITVKSLRKKLLAFQVLITQYSLSNYSPKTVSAIDISFTVTSLTDPVVFKLVNFD